MRHLLHLCLLLGCGLPASEDTSGRAEPPAPDTGADSDSDPDSDTDPAPPGFAVVASDGTGDYLDPEAALLAEELAIFVRAGTYTLTESLIVTQPGTQLRGENAALVQLVQSAEDRDLLIVEADDVVVSDLTLDTRGAGQAAFVQRGASGVTLRDTVVLGGDDIFAVYFSGPQVAAGPPTFEAYLADELPHGNRMIDNDITSSFVGDSVVFALQSQGQVSGTIVRSGMVSLYMTRDVECSGNSFLDSPLHGVFVSLPIEDLTLEGNTFRGSKYSALVVKPQLEHDLVGPPIESTGLVVRGNTMSSQLGGIEIDGHGGHSERGQLLEPLLEDNVITLDDFYGVFILRTVQPTVRSHQITFTGSDPSRRGVDGRPLISDMISAGIFLDVEVSGPTVVDNLITRSAAATDARVMQNAIVLHQPSVVDAVIRDNTFRRHGDGWVHSPCDQDFGPPDHDGVYVPSSTPQTITANVCEEYLP